jgi:hypothetical protein
MDICGLMVVRRPAKNYDPIGNGIWPQQPPQVGTCYYGGVWRMPWCDINFEFYNRILPGELRDLYVANVADLQGSGFGLCRIIGIANTFLEYCNRDQKKCELIAVHSPTLASMHGTIHLPNDFLEHRGWEPFQIGGGSLLSDGIYAVPTLFPAWEKKLNENGLLRSKEEASKYTSTYRQLADAGLLEELFPTDTSPIEAIHVLSVNTR